MQKCIFSLPPPREALIGHLKNYEKPITYMRTAEVKVRLTEREMEKLKELAKERDIAPSVFAYYLILKGLEEE